MSRREYKTIKRRMQAGRIASIKEGNYIGTNPPYGYRKIHPAPKVRTLEIVEEEANVIWMIFDDYLHHGKGAKAIATKLNLLQIPPQKADRWECVSVRKILKNPIYAGKILWHTKKDGDILAEGHHEGIISYESFCEVQKRMKKKAVPQTQVGTELKNYYHDVMFCGNCGHQMRRRPAKIRDGYMLCLRTECRGKVCCSPIEIVDEAVLAAVRARLNDLELSASNSHTQSQQTQHEEQQNKAVEEMQAALQKLKKQKDKLYTLLETDVYTTEVFVERLNIVEKQEKELKIELEHLRAEQEQIENHLDANASVAFLRQLLDEFSDAQPKRRNELLKQVIGKIVYYKTERMCRNRMQSDLRLDITFL